MRRRLLFWYLPLATALVAAVTFGAGFYSFLRGDTGKPVDFIARRNLPTAVSKQQIITPIILGDSLARGAGDQTGLGIGGRLDQELRRKNVRARRTVNIAINGARTADLLRQLDGANVRTLLGQSNVVILSIGGNDLWGGNDWRNAPPPDPAAVMDSVLARVEQAVKIVRQASPQARIFIVGLYNPFETTPLGAPLTSLVNRWNARQIDRFSSDPNVTVVQTVDIFAHHDRLSLDRFHPNEEGYSLMARRIADAL